MAGAQKLLQVATIYNTTVGEVAKKSSNYFINLNSEESLNDNFLELPKDLKSGF